MKEKYSFLKDPRALAEIRKHKWIESQKRGEEVGFASAAVDWIKRYGQEWKHIHVKEDRDYNSFFERRRFRRFKLDCCAELIKNNARILANAVNISFFGLSCRTTDYLHIGSEIGIHLPIKRDNNEDITYNGIVERILPMGSKKYELFLRFLDYNQQAIENCRQFNDT